jgi:hypothetical protein
VADDAVIPPFKMPAYSKPYPHYTWSEYNSTLFTTAVFLFLGKPDFIFRCLMTATLGEDGKLLPRGLYYIANVST